MKIGDEVRFKDNRTDRTFTIRAINDKKLIMGDYYAVAVISFTALKDVEWRGEVLQEEIEVVR